MQLESIYIEGLFGRFDYNIPLIRPEKITIIHAPNGFGKTVVLTLVNAFFSGQYSAFFKYQFKSLILKFDNMNTVIVRKEARCTLFDKGKDAGGLIEDVRISRSSGSEQFGSFLLKLEDSTPPLSRALPFIAPAGPDLWFDANLDEVVSTREVFERYSSLIPSSLVKNAEPDWLKEIMSAIDCRLIETQRLLRIAKSEDPRKISRRSATVHKSVVEVQARDLAARIASTLAEYANQSQTLDQSFPKRVIAAFGSGAAPLANDANRRLGAVERKRLSLIEAGLLDQSGAPEIISQAELEAQQVRQVIGVYLDDMEQKLSRFDDLFDRVSLFKEILNEKFQFKSVIVSREKGISVKADRDTDISLVDLSSGEQHELVMLYELLFTVKENSIILIDEPELSLHVGWQVRFIPDLQRIQKLRPMQIVLSTHSPQIINDRWDLTVELKSKQENNSAGIS